ncbi:MAG TPA: hypothetical protein VN249_07525, partial [Prolixibacteraceae bacterium]|nr:hypothetical protein [Prolixibacteraceae bacterium]
MDKELSANIQSLKEEVQNKFGRNILYTTDCHDLSCQIQDLLKRRLSISTLKRLFGMVPYSFSPSKFTLDTLAIYLHYEDWTDFIVKNQNEKTPVSQADTWEELKKRNGIITSLSLRSLKSKMGARFIKFPLRKIVVKYIDAFLKSPKTAMALVAPNGYGKSTLLTQATEIFFTGVHPKYPDYVVCLIDGGIFHNLLVHNPEMNELHELIEFNPLNNYKRILRNTPFHSLGKYILIIVGIDNIFKESIQMNQFVVNLQNIITFHEGDRWFKVLISCSPYTWKIISESIGHNPKIESLWYNMSTPGYWDGINIPLLKKKEINEILRISNHPKTLEELSFIQPDIPGIINNPHLLNLFLKTDLPERPVSEIDILKNYIQDTILSPPYLNDKYAIINSFFKLCQYGKRDSDVNKLELNLTAHHSIAYSEMVRRGILYEYTVPDSYLTLNTYVRFSSNEIFSYYLANILAREEELSLGLIKRILAEYSAVPNLQNELLKYTIKMLFREERIEVLKNIFTTIEAHSGSNNHLTFRSLGEIAGVIDSELRNNLRLRSILIHWYAKTEAGRKIFYENFFDIDSLVLYSGRDFEYYLKYNQSVLATQYANYVKFMKFFLSANHEKCHEIFEEIVKLKNQAGNNIQYSLYYYVPLLIYQSYFWKRVDKNVINQIYDLSETNLKEGEQSCTQTPKIEFAAIFALSYSRLNDEILGLSHYIFENYDLRNVESTALYQLFLSVYARTLLDIGGTEKALEIYDHRVKLKHISYPTHMQYYVKIRLML